MQLTNLQERLPVVYESGKPVAVLVDVATFQQIVEALERLDALDETEEPWLGGLVERVRAYRKANPEDVTTYSSPEAVLAALDEPDA
jgi:hypothetical protein